MNKYEIEIKNKLFNEISKIIEQTKGKVAIYLNAQITLLYWNIGNYILKELKEKDLITYGKNILATLSQELTRKYGKGFTYTALTRMMKVAKNFTKENIATMSQLLSWSHLIELSYIDDDLKRTFYTQMAVAEKWSVRNLRKQIDAMLFERTAIAKQPEKIIQQNLNKLVQNKALHPDLVFKNTYILDFLNLPADYSEKDLENALLKNLEQFIMELGNGFAFLERQKRIPVDSIDYYLDLLFYHRKLKRLVAIDLKLGKYKPEYKAQMELYLRWLEKYEMQENEEKPIGLLLCSEGNTEHIELLLLDEDKIKVARYLTELPSKEWFIDKLHKALELINNNENIQ